MQARRLWPRLAKVRLEVGGRLLQPAAARGPTRDGVVETPDEDVDRSKLGDDRNLRRARVIGEEAAGQAPAAPGRRVPQDIEAENNLEDAIYESSRPPHLEKQQRENDAGDERGSTIRTRQKNPAAYDYPAELDDRDEEQPKLPPCWLSIHITPQVAPAGGRFSELPTAFRAQASAVGAID
jgi:hypothetical protein